MHPFDRYFHKHHHYPRLRIVSGSQVVTVQFAPGYVSISTYPRGGTVYITRSAWFKLLRRAVPLTRKWKPHPDHDVPAAMHELYELEREILREQREQKRDRVPSKRQIRRRVPPGI